MTLAGLDRQLLTSSATYQNYVLDRADELEFDTQAVELTDGDDRLLVYVTSDAVELDGVRLNGSAKFSAQLAELNDAILPTTKITDEIWRQADDVLSPSPQDWAATVEAMIAHSARVDAQQPGRGLVAPVGKEWGLAPAGTVTHGWHRPDGTRIQGPQALHGVDFSDYSQILRWVLRDAQLNGEWIDLADVYADPELAHLVSYYGPTSIEPFAGSSPGAGAPAKFEARAQHQGGGASGVGLVGAGALALLVWLGLRKR